MYLKQIEIHGFKSFANDTVLTFEKGITAIVGPNGSGKSNIADAVRWVLGERSMKQLRGAETLDVIFSGTELRKAQGFAYVNIIIDNTDKKIPISYDEIQVSRRLYRNGESEYKLNNVDCRLKDIIELFYDTGIGKEGYSIIGQGQIDKILSNKPEDRRELFDEAVGIVKYKRRKTIAEKKLEEERLNLSRVSDIISEIERQIAPLKKQAEAAKEYLDIKDTLLLYEANFFVREVDAITKEIDEINKNIDINKEALKKLKEDKAAFNIKYNDIENQITKLDLEIAELKDALTDSKTRNENLKGQVNVINEQITAEQHSNTSRLSRIENYENNIIKSTNEVNKNFISLKLLKKQIELININNNVLDENDNQFNGDLSLINDSINNIKSLADEYGLAIDYNKTIDESTMFSYSQSLSKYDENNAKLQSINKQIEDEENSQKKLNNDLVKFHDDLESINEDLIKKQNFYLEQKTKLEALKSMLERNDGYQNAVKSILDNKNRFSGVIGVVADIINTKKEYELAIETALGNSIQNIVTDNVETSKVIINYLKNNKLGRVTTLPLSAIVFKENKMYSDALNGKGVVGLAVDIANFDVKFLNLANYLLKNCIIVDNYDNAKEIFKRYNSGIKVVTLNGELFNPGGAISGGSHRNSTTLIGRKREYDDLVSALPKLNDDIANLNTKKTEVAKLYDDTYISLEKCKENISAYNIEKNTVTLNIINDMKLEYSNISNKVQYLTDITSKLTESLKSDLIEKNKLTFDDESFDSTLATKENRINEINLEISTLNNKIHEIEVSIENKNNEKNENLSNRKEYYEAKDKLITEQITLEQESNNLTNQLDKSNNKIEEITNSMLEKYNLTYAAAREKYRNDLGTNEEIKNIVKEKRKVIQDLGPINVNAVEEYKEVGERYDVMTTQYEDIKKSEEMIAGIVDELDTSMKEQFNTNFKKIKEEFQEVFKILFGGGKANIELVEIDEKGELDAGVSIVAQPPGKKLTNMMQLSGGEKALTAIALLFAIQNLKPSPFCLLDEIEAALDESNVDRFADYLKNLTDETQFILITHRRGTMEKADRLYGITMQEKGITALVSVDLIEDQLS